VHHGLRAGWRPSVGFIDRDGTTIEERPYLSDPRGVTLLAGAAEGLRRLGTHGIPIAVLTNQSGVARGLISPEALIAVNQRLEELLREAGVRISGIFSCPHGPDEGCPCRKPEPGLAIEAARSIGVDCARGIVVGDRRSDLELARRIGAPAVLVTTGAGLETLRSSPAADYLVDNLDEFARLCTHQAGLPFGPGDR
jgi:D-glycero-D-manno-heptose 1,7-bisphosphate phosphatase